MAWVAAPEANLAHVQIFVSFIGKVIIIKNDYSGCDCHLITFIVIIYFGPV